MTRTRNMKKPWTPTNGRRTRRSTKPRKDTTKEKSNSKNMIETWKDIDGYEGFYQVSNLGRVRSLDRFAKKWDGEKKVKGVLLKQAKNIKGYLFVQLFRGGVGKMKTVHRLVADAFLPNPGGLPQINHKDEDKSNNYVDNLEWCDGLYNARYGTRNLRAGSSSSKAVLIMNADGSEYGRYSSVGDAASAVGRSKASICHYIKAGGSSPIGLRFKYL